MALHTTQCVGPMVKGLGQHVPEVALCEKLGIDMIWNVGGGKIQSSSELVKNRRQYE